MGKRNSHARHTTQVRLSLTQRHKSGRWRRKAAVPKRLAIAPKCSPLLFLPSSPDDGDPPVSVLACLLASASFPHVGHLSTYRQPPIMIDQGRPCAILLRTHVEQHTRFIHVFLGVSLILSSGADMHDV